MFSFFRSTDYWKKEELEKVASHIEQEARMILPGIQALFGFQLIACFNQRFAVLAVRDQRLHLAALLLTALSVLFSLLPAAYHRQVEPYEISTAFCRFGSRCLCLSMLALAFGTSLELFVIFQLITGSPWISGCVAGIGLLAYVGAWFVLTSWLKARRKKVFPRST